jgi:hypothetical protein
LQNDQVRWSGTMKNAISIDGKPEDDALGDAEPVQRTDAVGGAPRDNESGMRDRAPRQVRLVGVQLETVGAHPVRDGSRTVRNSS